MNSNAFVLLVGSATSVGAANLLMKSRMLSLSSGPLLGTIKQLAFSPKMIFAFMLVSFASVMWLKLLTKITLSTAYPIFVGVTYFIVAIGGAYFFGEKISAQKVAGVALLLSGILVISRG